MSKDRSERMSGFLRKAFYHRKFLNSLFVVKASGNLIETPELLENLVRDLKILTEHDINVLFVFGGGNAVDQGLKQRGIKVKKHNGRRITDAETLGVMRQVISGTLTTAVSSEFARQGLNGLVFNAVPGQFMSVEMRAKTPIDFGYVGDIVGTHSGPVMSLFKSAPLIALPCLAHETSGQICNINADTIATELAIGLQAKKLIFLSNTNGILRDGETIDLVTESDVPELIESGVVTDGMQVKVENCLNALNAGVRRIHLVNGTIPNALHNEIFKAVGPGTMLILDKEKPVYLQEVETHHKIEQVNANSEQL